MSRAVWRKSRTFLKRLSANPSVIKGESHAKIGNACVKSSPPYRLFRTLRLTETMRLTAIQYDPNADGDELFVPSFLLPLGEGCVTCAQEKRLVLPSSMAPKSDICRFFRAKFLGIEKHYMVDDLLTRSAIPKTTNAELEEINKIVGAYIPEEMQTFTSADREENKD